VAALVWKDPIMVVGGDTFASSMIEASGGCNAFADTPGRYPRVDPAALESVDPEVILLPTEPYEFTDVDRRELLELDCAAAESGRIHVIEGELLSWYGPRMARALRLFSELLAPSS
jgi:ABC-type Fe3+-hydroxamate transport system substrate-binding protein